MTTASKLSLTPIRLAGGVWYGILTGPADSAPMIEASQNGEAIAGAALSPLPGQPGHWAVELALPASVLSDGLQTVVLQADGEVLTKVTILAGAPLQDDLRAEIGLLRAELDLLKRAFQRHARG